MKKYFLIPLAATLILTSCSKDDLESKKAELSNLEKQQQETAKEIEELQAEILKLDPSFGLIEENATLVTVLPVEQKDFQHKVDVRGTIESHKNVMMSSELAGMVRSISVREGDRVSKGQAIIVLDSETLQRNIDELNTALDLAKIVYERQSKLWEQNVGSEIQYLEAKNRVESLEKSLATAKSQKAKATIRAPFSGSVDEIPVKEGEFAVMGMPMVRIVSLDQLYINTDVSENFVGKFKKNDEVLVKFPSLGEEVKSKIQSVSDVINRENRTFSVEIDLGKLDFKVKPNMVVIAQLTDYEKPQATLIPTNIILKDDIGNYVYTMEESDGKIRAKKQHIDVGVSYNSKTEVLSGLSADDTVVNQGFRELNDGTLIQIVPTETVSQL